MNMSSLTLEQIDKLNVLTNTITKLHQTRNVPICPSTTSIPTHMSTDDTSTSCVDSSHIPWRESGPGHFALPREIQDQILLRCDLGTLAMLRLTNYHLYELIRDLNEYKDLTTHSWGKNTGHASGTLRIMRDAEVLGYHSLAHVYRAFTSEECCMCGDFAPFVFLLSCERACYSCLERDQRTKMVNMLMAARVWCVSNAAIAGEVAEGRLKRVVIENFHEIMLDRQAYTMLESEMKISLFLASDIKRLALRIHDSEAEISRVSGQQYQDEIVSFNGVVAARRAAGVQSRAEFLPYNPLWCLDPPSAPHYDAEVQIRFSINPIDGYRCVAASWMPVFHAKQHGQPWPKIERGVWCVGCGREYNMWLNMENRSVANRDPNWIDGWESGLKPVDRAMRRAWSVEAFLRTHFEECEAVKAIWEKSFRRTYGREVLTFPEGSMVFEG